MQEIGILYDILLLQLIYRMALHKSQLLAEYLCIETTGKVKNIQETTLRRCPMWVRRKWLLHVTSLLL